MLLAISKAPLAALLGLVLLGSGALVFQRARGMGQRGSRRPYTAPQWPDGASAGAPSDADRRTLVSRFSRQSTDPPQVFADDLQELELPPSAASITLETVREAVTASERAEEDEQPPLPLTFATHGSRNSEPPANDLDAGSARGRFSQGTDPATAERTGPARSALRWNASDLAPDDETDEESPLGMSYASLVGEYLKRLRSPGRRGGNS